MTDRYFFIEFHDGREQKKYSTADQFRPAARRYSWNEIYAVGWVGVNSVCHYTKGFSDFDEYDPNCPRCTDWNDLKSVVAATVKFARKFP